MVIPIDEIMFGYYLYMIIMAVHYEYEIILTLYTQLGITT